MSSALRYLPSKAHHTPAEVAKFLDISIREIYDMISCDELPHIRLGRLIRIPHDEIETWYTLLREKQTAQ